MAWNVYCHIAAIINLIYAFATISLCANHIVYGMAMNILAPALASFIYGSFGAVLLHE